MPGIINTTIDTKDPLKNVATYDPEKVTLDPAKDTVEGRVESIIAKDSPLMTQAATRGKQYANSRGILNSTMAGEAVQGAVMDRAIPIAQQDANTSFATKRANQDAGNTALNVNANTINAAEGKVFDKNTTLDTIKAQTAGEVEIQNLRGAQAERIANIEGSYKNLIQSSQAASNYFVQASADMTRVLENPDIPVAQKQQLIDKQMELMEITLGVIGSIGNLDLSGLLTFN